MRALPAHSKQKRQIFDLAQAKHMLELILPKDAVLADIKKRFKMNVSSYFEPCEITGGDFWGCAPICNDHIAFYMADCSGHDFSSALNAFRLHALLEDIDDIYIRLIPANFLSKLNSKMCQLLPPEQFATFFYGVMNISTNQITYASAGSPAPVIIKKDGSIKVLENRGFPLGVTRDADYQGQKNRIQKR